MQHLNSLTYMRRLLGLTAAGALSVALAGCGAFDTKEKAKKAEQIDELSRQLARKSTNPLPAPAKRACAP